MMGIPKYSRTCYAIIIIFISNSNGFNSQSSFSGETLCFTPLIHFNICISC